MQTVIPTLTPELATLMSQQGTWMALQAQGAVSRLIDGGGFPHGSTPLGTLAPRAAVRRALPNFLRRAFSALRNATMRPAGRRRR